VRGGCNQVATGRFEAAAYHKQYDTAAVGSASGVFSDCHRTLSFAILTALCIPTSSSLPVVANASHQIVDTHSRTGDA